MTASALLSLIVLALAAIVLLAGLSVAAIAAHAARTVVRPRRDWRPDDWRLPDPAPESVTFAGASEHQLHGWYVAPPPRGPVVLVCHGFGTNRREGQDVLPWLTAQGWGVLLFDFQAHGESEGRYATVGARERDDALAAVSFIRARAGPAAVVLGLGFSMGASVLILAAAECDAIAGLVLDSPFATLRRAIARSFRLFFRLPPRLFTRPTIWFAEKITGARVGEIEPIRAIGSLAPRPLLIIQGTEDRIVDPEDSLLLFQAASEPKALWRLDGVDHVAARATEPDEYRRRVIALFERALDRRSGAMDRELLVADHLGVR